MGADYCAYCFKKIPENSQIYECIDCGLVFCSFRCKENHECGALRLPEIEIPWEKDEEIGGYHV